MCPLYKSGGETNEHLFYSCAYTKGVWVILRKQLSMPYMWLEDSLRNNINNFFNDNTLKTWRELPFTVYWCIWQSRNISLLNGKNIPIWVVACWVEVSYKDHSSSISPNIL